MKQREPTPAEQEMIEELEVARLRKQLATLKKLPDDFRDMAVMSSGWQSFAEIMGPEKKTEMLKWAKGGVLCLAPINDLERRVLAGHGELHEYNDLLRLEYIIRDAYGYEASFIYASDWPKHVIVSLNWLASHFGWNFRFLGQLRGEGGHALGL